MLTIARSIPINASASNVWKVLTDPRCIEQWISDDAIVVELDPKPGGAIRMHGDFHAFPLGNKGTVLAFEPNERFVYTFWSNLTQLPDVPENYFTIAFQLTANGDSTTLELLQTNLINEVILKHWELYWNVTLDLIRGMAEKAAVS
jgi:uncharacterized protein YndB with AHSA1/START domain